MSWSASRHASDAFSRFPLACRLQLSSCSSMARSVVRGAQSAQGSFPVGKRFPALAPVFGTWAVMLQRVLDRRYARPGFPGPCVPPRDHRTVMLWFIAPGLPALRPVFIFIGPAACTVVL